MKSVVSAATTVRAQFYDLDPMNIVWHGNYAKFFEIGRCALLSKIGYDYRAMEASPLPNGKPPLKSPISSKIKRREKKITTGHTVHVALDMRSKEMQWETPPVLREKLAPYLA